MPDVLAVEHSTRVFAATDADVGGGLSREAAVGQLKYAVDLTSYSDAMGNRLLAAIAELSGLVGWLCHDCGMPGPTQRYLMYGLQAAVPISSMASSATALFLCSRLPVKSIRPVFYHPITHLGDMPSSGLACRGGVCRGEPRIVL